MVNHATIIFGLASSPVDMFLAYFHPFIIIIMHHRTRHGYARSLIPILHLIQSPLSSSHRNDHDVHYHDKNDILLLSLRPYG